MRIRARVILASSILAVLAACSQQKAVGAATCAEGQTCSGGKVCKDLSCVPCGADVACPGGLVCQNGLCQSCASAADCPAGEACISGLCGPCHADADCTSPFACMNGKCTGCATNADCRSGEACSAAHVCGLCAASTDCASTQACVNQACGSCTSASQCRAGQICGAGGACGPCSTLADCSGGQACVNGACGPCAHDSDCGTGACVNQVCTLPTGSTCMARAQCASGFCSDGFCCDKACGGGCESCAGVRSGTCSPAAAGTDPKGACTPTGYVCGGTSGVCPGFCSATDLPSVCASGRYCNNSKCAVPQASCAAQKSFDATSVDGTYYVGSATAPSVVYCDMTLMQSLCDEASTFAPHAGVTRDSSHLAYTMQSRLNTADGTCEIYAVEGTDSTVYPFGRLFTGNFGAGNTLDSCAALGFRGDSSLGLCPYGSDPGNSSCGWPATNYTMYSNNCDGCPTGGNQLHGGQPYDHYVLQGNFFSSVAGTISSRDGQITTFCKAR